VFIVERKVNLMCVKNARKLMQEIKKWVIEE